MPKPWQALDAAISPWIARCPEPHHILPMKFLPRVLAPDSKAGPPWRNSFVEQEQEWFQEWFPNAIMGRASKQTSVHIHASVAWALIRAKLYGSCPPEAMPD